MRFQIHLIKNFFQFAENGRRKSTPEDKESTAQGEIVILTTLEEASF